jgi:uncharacterized membrane protein YhfC
MKPSSPLAAFRKHGLGAAIAVALIITGHWLRTHQLDWMDLLTGAIVFLVFVAIAAWASSRRDNK